MTYIWPLIGALGLLSLVGFFNFDSTSTRWSRAPKNITEILIGNVDGQKIVENLRAFTAEPHVAGTPANKRVAQKIADTWKANGLEDVHFVEYTVLLNYPNYEDPNHATIIDTATGRTIFESVGISPVILPDEQGAEGAGIQWLAYSPNGIVEADVVYCHYGNPQDFERLSRMGISVKGQIALMRYDGQFRASKILNAQRNGAIGAILYSDPMECAQDGVDQVYPQTVWMPSGGVQRGTIKRMNGDPLTPLYPSRSDLFHSRTIDEARQEEDLPSIPALPLSYGSAYNILSKLAGPQAPQEWRGGLNFTYHIGPGFNSNSGGKSSKLRLKVNSFFQNKKIQNVVGYIHGVEEPDEYVMLGNHFDAWVYGAIDPNSGTASLAEVARALTRTMHDASWRPARTIVFCAWDAEEYGLVGSTEFVQDFINLLADRAAIYLNVDLIVANRTFNADTVPQLFDVVVETARCIPNPMKDELAYGRMTVYDTWVTKNPGHRSWLPGYPDMKVPGGGSDHSPFLTYAGIPVVDFRYQNASQVYPLYHTLYETPFVNEHLYDIDHFAVHRSVGQYWAELARRFADDAIYPLNISTLARTILAEYVFDLKKALEEVKIEPEALKSTKQQLTFLIRKCQEFISAADAFMDTNSALSSKIRRMHSTKSDSVKGYNDKIAAKRANQRLKAVDRCFVNPRGSPTDATMRHVLYSLSADDAYSGNVMPTVYAQLDQLRNAKTDDEKAKAGHDLTKEISIVQYSLQCAINTIAQQI